MDEIFKFPPHLDPFGQVNYLYELSSGYSNDPIQKWYDTFGLVSRLLQTDSVNYRKPYG